MYQQISERFGGFEKRTFYNARTGNLMSIVPGCGACLTHLYLRKQSLLDAYRQPEELLLHLKSKSEFLLPFPNRLKDGQYTFEGKSYRLPINETTNKHAIHGFAKGENMPIQSCSLEADRVQVVCGYSYDGRHAFYPFPFDCKIQFELSDERGLTVDIQLSNSGDRPLPVGLGWHPYFSLGGLADDWLLQLPASQQVLVDDRMIPTGERIEFSDFVQARRIGDIQLDTCLALENDSEGQSEIWVSKGSTKLRYWQQTGVGKFNYYQLFIPPTRQSLAIEPMSCNVDTFNNGDGLVILQPGEHFGGSFGVELQKG